MEAKEFGEYLKGIRKSKKMTIRQLELYSKVSNAYISQLERGDRGLPSPDILKKLSQPLGVEYNELMIKAGYISEDLPLLNEKSPAEELIEYLEMELSSEEIIRRMNFTVDGMTLTDEEASEFVDFVRVKRAMKRQQAVSKGEEL